MKRLLSIILALIMFVSATVVTASAEDEVMQSGFYEYTLHYSNSYGRSAVIKKYNGNEKNVVIPSRLGGYPVDTVFRGAFDSHEEIETVTFPDTMLEIDVHSFARCTSLRDVYIPNSVVSCQKSAFILCTSLQNFHVDSNNSTYCDIDGVLCSKDKTTLCTFPSGREGVYVMPECIKKLPTRSFCDCKNLEFIIVTGEIESIGSSPLINITSYNDDGNTGAINRNVIFIGHAYSYLQTMRVTGKTDISFFPFELGDVNGDGRITAVDSLLVQRSVIGLAELSKEQKNIGNADHNGSLTNNDALIILRHSLGLETSGDYISYISDLCDEYNVFG